MKIINLNESFNKKFDSILNESVQANELKVAITNKLSAIPWSRLTNQLQKVKNAEYAIQEGIESIFPDNSWWEVTDVDIFGELFAGNTPEEVTDMIIADVTDKAIVESCESEECDKEAFEDEEEDKEVLTEQPLDESLAEDVNRDNIDINKKIYQAVQTKGDAKKYKDEIEAAIPGAKVDTSIPKITGPNGKELSKAINDNGGYKRDSIVGPDTREIGHISDRSWGTSKSTLKDIARLQKRKEQDAAKYANYSIGDAFRDNKKLNTVQDAENYIDELKNTKYYDDEIKNDKARYNKSRQHEKSLARMAHERKPYNNSIALHDDNDMHYTKPNKRDVIDYKNYLTKQTVDKNELQGIRTGHTKDFDRYYDLKSNKQYANSNLKYNQKEYDDNVTYGKSRAEQNYKAAMKRAADEYNREVKRVDSNIQYYKNRLDDAKMRADKANTAISDLLNKHRKPKTESIRRFKKK